MHRTRTFGARVRAALALLVVTVAWPLGAAAEDGLDSGDTAWILTSTALVLFMTLPGLALFYGGWCARRTCSRCSCSAWRSPPR